MAISSQKLLGGSSSRAIVKVSSKKINLAKISSDPISNKNKEDPISNKNKEDPISNKNKEIRSSLISDLKYINKKTIAIDKILKNQILLKKKEEKNKRSKEIRGRRKKRETNLEKQTKKEKEKSGVKRPDLPGTGIFGAIGRFIFWTLAGNLILRFLNKENLQKAQGFVNIIAKISGFVVDFGGKILNGLVTFIDWGYKAYDWTRGVVGNIFGEEGVKKFDELSNVLNKALNLAIIGLVGVLSFGDDLFGGGGKGKGGKGNVGILGRKAGRTRAVSSAAARRYAQRFGKDAAIKKFGAEGVKSLGGKYARTGATNFARKGLVGVLGKRGAAQFLKATTGIFGRVPIIGPIIVAVTSLLSGEGISKALFKGFGAALGGFLGTFIPIPVLGTLMGEMLGTYVGDILHTLILGGGIKALGSKLRRDLQKVFETGKAAFEWLKGGISRYFSSFFKENTVNIPEGFGARSAVTSAVKLIPGLYQGLSKLNYLEKDQVSKFPNLLQLFNPFKTIPLAIKSFFPRTPSPEAKVPDMGSYTQLFSGMVSEGYIMTSITEGVTQQRQAQVRPGAVSSLGSGGGSLKDLTDRDFEELAYIVSGEAARGTDDEYGVAAAVLNRVTDPRYPNTIQGVGAAPGQFEAVYTGKARYDSALAKKLKDNQGKIVEALKKLQGRTDFKGQSQLANMGPGDIMFDNRGNFYHYAEQRSIADPPPGNIPQNWKKLLGESTGGSFGGGTGTGGSKGGGAGIDIKTGAGYGSKGSLIAGELGRFLKKELRQGPDFQAVTEHPEHGGVKGVHSPNSYHYDGRAIDIGAWDYEQPKILQAIKKFNEKHGVNPVELLHAGNEPAGHSDHVHAAYAGGGVIKTPSKQSKYNSIQQYKNYGGTSTLAIKKIYIKV